MASTRLRAANVAGRLASGDEVLREEEPEPFGALESPTSATGAAHINNWSTCPRFADLQPRQFVLVAADGNRGVGRHVRGRRGTH